MVNAVPESVSADGIGSGITATAFGGVALGAVIFFAEGIPRVQEDILKASDPSRFARGHVFLTPLQKIPLLGNYWVGKRDIPASDNVSITLRV